MAKRISCYAEILIIEIILFSSRTHSWQSLMIMLFHRQCIIYKEAKISCTGGKRDALESDLDQYRQSSAWWLQKRTEVQSSRRCFSILSVVDDIVSTVQSSCASQRLNVGGLARFLSLYLQRCNWLHVVWCLWIAVEYIWQTEPVLKLSLEEHWIKVWS